VSSDRYERVITNTGEIKIAAVIVTPVKPMFVSQMSPVPEFKPAFTGQQKGVRTLKQGCQHSHRSLGVAVLSVRSERPNSIPPFHETKFCVESVQSDLSVTMSRRAARIVLSRDDAVRKILILSWWLDSIFQLHAPAIGSVRVQRDVLAREKLKEVEIRDAPGHERYLSLTSLYVRHSRAVVVVIDVPERD
jgi:hypothetical protein